MSLPRCSVAYREILAARRSEARAHRHFDEVCAQEILAAYQRRAEKVDTTTHREALRRRGKDLEEMPVPEVLEIFHDAMED